MFVYVSNVFTLDGIVGGRVFVVLIWVLDVESLLTTWLVVE